MLACTHVLQSVYVSVILPVASVCVPAAVVYVAYNIVCIDFPNTTIYTCVLLYVCVYILYVRVWKVYSWTFGLEVAQSASPALFSVVCVCVPLYSMDPIKCETHWTREAVEVLVCLC